MKLQFLMSVGLALLLSACGGDDCRSYSEFTCEEIRKANYNVVFVYPSGADAIVGRATGLSQCNAVARSHAAAKRIESSDWRYVCCMIARGSSCFEKHR